MANYYTSFTIALSKSDVPSASTDFDEIWKLANSVAPYNQFVRSISRHDWILEIIKILTTAGHIPSLQFLQHETAVVPPEHLNECVLAIKTLLQQFSIDPEKFANLFASNHYCYSSAELQAALKQTIVPYGLEGSSDDGDDLKYLLHFLHWHLALFELAIERGLYIFYIRCEEFLTNREA